MNRNNHKSANMNKNNYYTIIDAISDLQARGFTLDFSLVRSKLFYVQEQRYLEAEEFDVVEMYHFHAGRPSRGKTDVFAIESLIRPLKGILLYSFNQAPTQVPKVLKRSANSVAELL